MSVQGPETLTFREFATQQFIKRSGYQEPPTGLGLSFNSHEQYKDEPRRAVLRANYFPPMFGHGPGFSDELWEVDGIGFWRYQAHEDNAITLHVREFPVYDFDVNRITDPKVIDPIPEIDPGEVLVLNTQPYDLSEIRKLGVVVDPSVKSRILEWHQASRSRQFWNETEKYVALRKAPFTQDNVPGYSHYTYQGVLNDAFAKQHVTTLGWREIDFRMFTPEDVEWLKEFMRNQGLETPEIEELPHYRLT